MRFARVWVMRARVQHVVGNGSIRLLFAESHPAYRMFNCKALVSLVWDTESRWVWVKALFIGVAG